METRIGNPENLWLMSMVFVTTILAAWVAWQRRQALNRLASASLLSKLLGGHQQAPWMSTALTCGAFFFLTLSLLDLRWGKTEHEIPQKGIEVVFALDVSRSMLAEDVAPNRLQRAKQQIKDLMDEMVGDRVGLVAFAGDAKAMIPLTSHFDDFKSTLDGIGPHSVRIGGSRLGDALTIAGNSFSDTSPNHKAIVVLTDGEDQESDPVNVATTLFEKSGIQVFTIGLGDWQKGAKIPVENDRRNRGQEFLTYRGDTVLSKQDGETLKNVALAANGAYIPAGTKFVDMAEVYAAYIAPIEKTEFETAKVQAYEARFQWFALPAVLCLLAELFWKTRAQKKSSTSRRSWFRGSQSTTGKVAAGTLLLAFLLSGVGTVSAQTDATTDAPLPWTNQSVDALNAANQQVRSGDPQAALESYQLLAKSGQDSSQNQSLVQYNQAIALHAAGDIPAAIASFSEAATSQDKTLAAKSRYNLGNCLVESTPASDEPEFDATAATTQLQTAIQAYRDALRLNPDLDDARANIAFAYRRLKEIQNQQQDQQQQDQQQQDQQQQDQQDQDQDNQSQQNQDSQNDESDAEQQNEQQQTAQQQSEQQESDSTQQDGSSDSQSQQQSSEQPDSETENKDQQGDSQQQQGDQQGSDSQNSDQQKDDQPTGDPQDQQSQSAQDGSSPSDQQPKPDPAAGQGGSSEQQNQQQTQQPKSPENNDESSQAQTLPNEQMNDQAGDAEQSQSDANADQQEGKEDQTGQPSNPQQDAGQLESANDQFSEGKPAENGQANGSMTMQEAMKILQSIRDRNFQRRADLQRRESMRRIPVERDW